MNIRHFFQSVSCSLLLLLTIQVQAASSVALRYEPKYNNDFTNFDYVNPAAPKRGELILPAPPGLSGFDSLNPFLLKGIPPAYSTELLLEPLMERSLDEPFSMYGLLAQEIQLAEDKLSVTFRLNPNARFSNDSEVTAEDVKFSFEKLTSQQANPDYRFYWADIQKVEVIDKYTVRFFFKKVNPELHLIIGGLPVFSKAAAGDKPFEKITDVPLVGTGPYTIDKFSFGKFITYKRNPKYWANELNTRRGMYNFELITVKSYKESSIALEALKAGEVNFISVYNSKEWARNYGGEKFAKGELKKMLFPHQSSAGMQALILNLRRPFFQDIRVRRALNLAFDFEWANKNLFYDQYSRCNSYFSNSELAAKDLPTPEEIALLEPFRQQLPPEVFTKVWQPVTTAPPQSLQENLKKAAALLTEAGWTVRDGVLQNAQGQKLAFEALLNQEGFDRILAPYASNLKKLGIQLTYRVVDGSLYQQRTTTFDFDATIQITATRSQSPGNELMSQFHSSSAKQEGSNNWMGLANPVVDALVEKVIYATNRQSLVTAVHALDRVLLWGDYVVPNWYTGTHRTAFTNKFGRPEKLPLYYSVEEWVLSTWWQE